MAELPDAYERPSRDVCGPVRYSNGSVVWYYKGSVHRDDGPAIIRADGTRRWYRHGKYYHGFEHWAEGYCGPDVEAARADEAHYRLTGESLS